MSEDIKPCHDCGAAHDVAKERERVIRILADNQQVADHIRRVISSGVLKQIGADFHPRCSACSMRRAKNKALYARTHFGTDFGMTERISAIEREESLNQKGK